MSSKNLLKIVLKKLGLLPLAAKFWNLAFYRKSLAKTPSNLLYILHFLLFDKELSNFTYDLSKLNIEELIDFLSKTLNVPSDIVRSCVEELESDSELRSSLEQRLRQRKDRNNKARYGRRIGWYSVARIIKPSLIVETGTHDGLGSSILARALYRNKLEGYPGLLITFDIDKSAGWLLDPDLGNDFSVIIEDTRIALDKYLKGLRVGFFIHDSDHRYEHETFELETVSKYLSEGAVIISDNAHGSTAMKDFSRTHHLEFALFREQPIKHFYPGGGIGLLLYRSQG